MQQGELSRSFSTPNHKATWGQVAWQPVIDSVHVLASKSALLIGVPTCISQDACKALQSYLKRKLSCNPSALSNSFDSFPTKALSSKHARKCSKNWQGSGRLEGHSWLQKFRSYPADLFPNRLECHRRGCMHGHAKWCQAQDRVLHRQGRTGQN